MAHHSAHRPGRFVPRGRAAARTSLQPTEGEREASGAGPINDELLAPVGYSADAKVLSTLTRALLDIKV